MRQTTAAATYSQLLIFDQGLFHAGEEARAFEAELRQSHPHRWVANTVKLGKQVAVQRALDSLPR